MTFTAGLSNYPPGVSGATIDRWLGESERDSRRCSCGAFLPDRPVRTKDWEALGPACDGRLAEHTTAMDEVDIRILGEQYRGKTWTQSLTPCGETAAHSPHQEPVAGGTLGEWDCRRCGKVYRDEV